MLRLENVTVRCQGFALTDISLSIASGEYAVLMGPTGSGKTTLLESICGLRPIADGKIWIDGQDVTPSPPEQRGVGYAPQDAALFAHLSVRRNIAFPLLVRNRSASQIEEKVDCLANQLGVSHLLDRGADRLSGGERQRVSLARALAASPRLLLLDEPLSALDEQARSETTALLLNLQQDLGVTTLHVTHSLAEAEQIDKRIIPLAEARLVAGSPNGAAG